MPNWKKIAKYTGKCKVNKKKKMVLQSTIDSGKIQKKFNAWWAANQKYTKAKTCIICTKKPNCLEKNWLTKVEFEKVRFCVDVYMFRGLKEPSES